MGRASDLSQALTGATFLLQQSGLPQQIVDRQLYKNARKVREQTREVSFELQNKKAEQYQKDIAEGLSPEEAKKLGESAGVEIASLRRQAEEKYASDIEKIGGHETEAAQIRARMAKRDYSKRNYQERMLPELMKKQEESLTAKKNAEEVRRLILEGTYRKGERL